MAQVKVRTDVTGDDVGAACTREGSDGAGPDAVGVSGSAGESRRSSVSEIVRWMRGYLQRHPVASFETVGGQSVLGIRAIQYLILVDLP
jgi:phospholipid/cholesterol/gamma-HCH transport system permease protein